MELYDLYSSPNINSGDHKRRWAGNAERMRDMTSVCTVLVGKSEENEL